MDSDSKIKNTTYNYDDLLDLLRYIYQADEPLSSHEEVVKTWLKTKIKDDKK